MAQAVSFSALGTGVATFLLRVLIGSLRYFLAVIGQMWLLGINSQETTPLDVNQCYVINSANQTRKSLHLQGTSARSFDFDRSFVCSKLKHVPEWDLKISWNIRELKY